MYGMRCYPNSVPASFTRVDVFDLLRIHDVGSCADTVRANDSDKVQPRDYGTWIM